MRNIRALAMIVVSLIAGFGALTLATRWLNAQSVIANDHLSGKNIAAGIHGFSGVSGGSGRSAISSNSLTRATAQCRRMVGSLTPSASAIS